MNSTNDGIQLNNCTNVTIDSCFVTNVRAGVNAMQCQSIKVNHNQFLNMNGPFPSGNFVQLNNVSGSGIQVNYNRCEDIAGVAQHPQDGISIYQCDGLPGDSVQVIGNWIRGGQVQNDSGGGAGVVLGDVGGSYQVARDNIVVNGGFVGMQGLRGVPTSVNRQPAIAFYQWRQHEGAYLPLTLDVLRVTGGAITEIVTFHDDQFARLGLPERLPADGA